MEYPTLQHAWWHQCLCGRVKKKHQNIQVDLEQFETKIVSEMQLFLARVEGGIFN